jgi:uncharacterized membrane protein YphA (DoxX/SURF4 family)
VKKNKIIFWSATGFLALAQGSAGIMNFFAPAAEERFKAIGYPHHLLILLGVLEVLGVLALIIPKVPFRLKEWAYAGFVFLYIGALVAHMAVNDSMALTIQPIISFVVLAVSYIYFHKLNKVFV